MSVVSLLGEIKLYLQISLKIYRKHRRREIILHFSSIRDEKGNVLRLVKRYINGNNCKYSNNSRSVNLVTLTTLIIKAAANVFRASHTASDISV